MWVTASLRAGGLRDTKVGLDAAGWFLPGEDSPPLQTTKWHRGWLSLVNMSLFNKV